MVSDNKNENGKVRMADWVRVWLENRPWLRSVILARLGEPQAVDEVLQEVALAVTAGQNSLSDPLKMVPWMYQIAVRQTLLYRRRHGRRRKLVDRYADRMRPTEVDSHSPNPLTWLIAREQSAIFRKVLQETPARDREILLLKYFHDWSYRQIAERLGLTESAVETRLHRARKRLRERLVRREVVGSVVDAER